MDRIVDIETDRQHLSATRGFLRVEREREEVGRIPLDDIAAVIVHAHGITYSNSLLVALAERNALLVTCGPNQSPVSCVWPIEGHHLQGARMRAQWNAGKPLRKRLWRQVVVAKIEMQAAILAAHGQKDGALRGLAKKVRSGDPENLEAQAARRYWPLLFGENFRRDRAAGGLNGLLNYGYTVLRAATARSLLASGLHPTIGLHHSNRSNAFALADDLMEPFRPLVDHQVIGLRESGIEDICPEAKATLVDLMTLDLPMPHGASPLSVSLQRLSHSLAAAFEAAGGDLDLPLTLRPLDLPAPDSGPAP
ncbi:type II CRISPR-associated endonuclease Cas1 [Denitrobaculum tricleocarpae]|uniref:CRISPR-associated endonuclease Cas1 n=1 Tax=Denitrobaculum tricleocarpae TaxID=2591009 RepID=A0A545TP78_9PROT|nr:type II CRISPR-associated endonuclease Cas1 [Denitrobaculum tricleocarpae]TQV78978.1 type II CRISPR-associated endonuclease Cas1 [Denitrobaculum tricleocarpae]